MEFKTSGPLTLEQLLEGVRLMKEDEERYWTKEAFKGRKRAFNTNFYMFRRAQYQEEGFSVVEAKEKALEDVRLYGYRW
jgi:hypothetical protein